MRDNLGRFQTLCGAKDDLELFDPSTSQLSKNILKRNIQRMAQ